MGDVSSINSSEINEDYRRDLLNEDRIQTNSLAERERDLLADRDLMQELSLLPLPVLPPRIRNTALAAARPDPTAKVPLNRVAVAALFVVSVGLLLVFSRDQGGNQSVVPTDHDWAELKLAFDQLHGSGARIAKVTTRGVSPHLEVSTFTLRGLDLQIDSIPYPKVLRDWRQRVTSKPR
ncbi:MAG: hypothetical protein AAF583_17095 [Pseudomonadota bacterium]